jgi:hypothetical protein
MSDTVASLQGLSRHFGRKVALREVTLDITRGASWAWSARMGPARRRSSSTCSACMHLRSARYAWTAVGPGAALALARSWLVAGGGRGSVALLVVFLFSLHQKGPFLLVFPTVCLVATLPAFVAAHRRWLISRTMLVTCLVIYILFCFATMSAVARIRGDNNPLDVCNQFLLAGYCAAPFAPLAAAPWALSWNRHR